MSLFLQMDSFYRWIHLTQVYTGRAEGLWRLEFSFPALSWFLSFQKPLSPICGLPAGYKGVEGLRHFPLQHGTM